MVWAMGGTGSLASCGWQSMSLPPDGPLVRAEEVAHFARVILANKTAFCIKEGLDGGDKIAGSEIAHRRDTAAVCFSKFKDKDCRGRQYA
jgi:hypothetical protein